ncbi:MAG: hypothetical protein BroJett014_11930 [Planctomycetota bacterium]|nr:hypothetical protein [Planctomycetota bacterium]GIK52220.1 MAG: hypothetical protein BroJett014_11930 [Planctomycetota bacterium]
MKRLATLQLLLLATLVAACNGDFDQRVDVAKVIGEGAESTATTVNPSGGVFVRGTVSLGGAVRFAQVTLRPVRSDGSIEFDDTKALGSTTTFDNGIYQAIVRDPSYRGPIVVEVRGQNVAGVVSDGGNPATFTTQKFHIMTAGHVLYSVLPMFDGYSAGSVDVTPLTTCAVTRGEFYGGVSAGMFGIMSQNVAQFFGLGALRGRVPVDFASSGSFGKDWTYAYVLAALGQVARNIGVSNVWDFYLGMSRDCRDDGMLNGSIGLVPNTGIAMPDLSAANILRDALFNDYLAPGNIDRLRAPDNTSIAAGGDLDNLLTALTPARNINGFTYTYDFVLRVPGTVRVAPGQEYATRIFAVEYYGGIALETYGDSGGPGFVDYQFVSSSPANVSVSSFGRIVVPLGATPGTYTVTVNIAPAIAQTFVSGAASSHVITVVVP